MRRQTAGLDGMLQQHEGHSSGTWFWSLQWLAATSKGLLPTVSRAADMRPTTDLNWLVVGDLA